MPVAKRKPAPDPNARRLWTKAACLGAHRYPRESAEIFAATDRRTRGSSAIAFRCPHGDHYHVGPPPLACAACGGTGRSSRNGPCSPCGETGVQRA